MTDLFSERCGDLLTGTYDCVDRIVLNAYFSLGHSPGGFRVWWRRWHGESDEQLDNAHLMRLAGRFARRVRASAQAHGIAVIDCKAEDRKHQIAEEVPGRASGGHGRVPDPRGPGAGDGVEGQPVRGGSDPSPGEDEAVRQPLLVSRHGPDVGACDDQDQRPPAVRRSGDPQRPRVRRLRRAESPPRLRQGGELLHSGQRTRALGSDRRHLLPTGDDRAPEPGHRPVDLHRVPVLRAQTSTSSSKAASSTTIRSTRSSTAATCCSPPAR